MLGHYLTVALRSFRRAPFTASVNVFALALGLTAFVMAYGVVSYWDQSERQFSNAERTYVITADLEARDGSIRTGVTPSTNRLYAEYLRADFPELEAVGRVQVMNAEAGVAAGDVYARMFVVGAEAEFLEIFDLPFVAGDRLQALREPNSAVLTEDAAVRLFGDADPLGQTITLGSVLDVNVTGVLGAIPQPSHLGRAPSSTLRFEVLTSWDTLDGVQAAARARNAEQQGPGAGAQGQPPPEDQAQGGQPQPQNGSQAPAGGQPGAAPAAAPPANTPPPPENWLGGYCCTTYAMLREDSRLTAAELNAQLREWGERRLPEQQAALASLTVGAVPVTGLMVTQLNAQLLGGGGMSITTLLLLLGGVVLVVACVNYANLATAQAARRAREVGLRKAIGAARHRVMLQYLAEATLLTLAALAVALIAIRLLAPAVRASIGIDLGLALFADAAVWPFLALLLAAVTLIGGGYPAFVLSRLPPVAALRVGRMRIGPRFAGTILVGLQFAAASFLLIVVIVMFAQNRELQRTGLGAAEDPLVVIMNASQFSGVDTELLQTELARLPQVRGVTEAARAPWSSGVNLIMFGRTADDSGAITTAFAQTVGYDFFETLGFEVLAGRVFDRAHGEDMQQGPLFNPNRTVHVVASASLVRQIGFASPADAVDQIIYLPERMTRAFGQPAQPVRIVGVVEDKPLSFSGAGATASVYMLGRDLLNQIVRLSASDVSGGLAAIDALWRRLSPRTSVNRDFVDELFAQNYENFARINQAFVGLALFAIVISVIGLFGMAIQVASRRVHEIGVRKSFGARKGQVIAMLLRDFAKPVLIANLAVWPLAYLASQAYLSVFMQRISVTPVPFVVSLVAAIGIAWLAVGGQAWRAARVSPANVLRFE